MTGAQVAVADYAFIVTNLPTGGEGFDTATEVEQWFRMRTDIEDRIREAKLGAG